MKARKLTSSVIALSMSLLMGFSSIVQPALAQEGGIVPVALGDSADSYTGNPYTTNNDDENPSPSDNSFVTSPSESPELTESPAPTETPEITETPTPSESPAAASDHAHGDSCGCVLREDGTYVAPEAFEPTGDDSGVPSISGSARARGIMPMAGSLGFSDVRMNDLTDWIVYDTYNTATKPSTWDTNENANGKHPHFYFAAYGTPVYDLGWTDDAKYTANRDYMWNSVLQNPVDDGAAGMRGFANHVYPENRDDYDIITFLGYQNDNRTNWAIAPTTDTKLKSINFNIDARRTSAHSLSNFGFLINADIVDISGTKYLQGYYISFQFYREGRNQARNGGTVALINLTAENGGKGMIAANWHEGNPTRLLSQAYTSGNPTNTVYASSVTQLGTFDMSNKFQVMIDVDPSNMNIVVNNIYADGSMAQQLAKTVPLSNSGLTGMGPLVNFSDDYGGHYCSMMSYVRYEKLVMTYNYALIFDKNIGEGSLYTIIKDINPDHSLYMMRQIPGATPSAYDVPADPTRQGWAFLNWAEEPGGGKPVYDVDNFVLAQGQGGQRTLYAQWQKIENPIIDIQNPQNNWTNQDITLTYDVKAMDQYGLDSVNHSVNGGAPVDLGIAPGTPNAQGPNITFTQNGTLDVEAKHGFAPNDPTAGANASSAVTKIDKTYPWLDHSAVPHDTLITANDLKVIKHTDYGDNNGGPSMTAIDGVVSGIDGGKTTFYLYAEDGTNVGNWPLSKIIDGSAGDIFSGLSGVYYYDIIVTDNAGNWIDSYGHKYGQNNTGTTDPTPGQVVEDNKPGKDDDHKIIVNAAVPKITFSPVASTWTNQDVVVYATASSTDGLGLDKVTYTHEGVLSDAGLVAPWPNADSRAVTFTKNSELSVYARNAKVNSLDATDLIKVEYIDKTHPLLDITAVNNTNTITSADEFKKITHNDEGDFGDKSLTSIINKVSGIDYSKSTFYLYDKNGTDVGSWPLADVLAGTSGLSSKFSSLTGVYYFDVILTDNAGNWIDSYGNKFGQNPATDPDPDEQIDENKKDPDDDHKVIINAKAPVVDIVDPVPAPGSNGYFKSGEALDVTYTVTSDLPLEKIVLPDGTVITLTESQQTYNSGSGKWEWTGTFPATSTAGVSETKTFEVEATDNIGKSGDDTTTIKFDGEGPTITIPSTISTGSTITITDSESGVNDSDTKYTLTNKDTGKTETATSGTLDKVLEEMGSGDYTVTVESKDNVGNDSKKDGTFYYEAPGSNVGDKEIKVDVKHTPDTDTKNDVTVTVTITGQVKLKYVYISTSSNAKTTGRKIALNGAKTLTDSFVLGQNEKIYVDYETEVRGLNRAPNELDYDVTNIDKVMPVLVANGFVDNGAIGDAKTSTVNDPADLPRYKTTGVAKVELIGAPTGGGGGVITETATNLSTNDAVVAIQQAVENFAAKFHALLRYNVTVKITDSVGNVNTYTYTNMGRTAQGDYADISITRNEESAKAGAMVLDIRIPDGTTISTVHLEHVEKDGSISAPVQVTGWVYNPGRGTWMLSLTQPASRPSAVHVTVTLTDNTQGDTNGKALVFPGSTTSVVSDGITWPAALQDEMTFAQFNGAYSKSYGCAAPVAKINSKIIKTYGALLANAQGDINGVTKTIASLRSYKGYIRIQLNVTLTDGTTAVRLSDPIKIK